MKRVAAYRVGDRRVEVADGKVLTVHGPESAHRGIAKLPKRFRAEVRAILNPPKARSKASGWTAKVIAPDQGE